MKISFDFDSTLAEDLIQQAAQKFIDDGHEVWITTTRLDENQGQPHWNKDLYAVADRLGIPRECIQFTNGSDKWHYLDGFDVHFDDDLVEVLAIKKNLPSCAPILVYDP